MDDRTLVDHILSSGDRNAFAEIVSRYSAMIFHKSLSVARDRELAREAVQRSFVKAWTKLSTWRGSGSIGPWLAAIAFNETINLLTHRRRMMADQLTDNHHHKAEEYSIEQEQLLQRMENAINHLEERERNIIRLFYYKEKKVDEIAALMNLSQSNVLVILHRTRIKLKKQLEDER